jgi:hypothetical protein
VRILQREKSNFSDCHPPSISSLIPTPPGVKPPKMFPFVSKITVRVFAWPSHRRWNSFASKSSQNPAP